MTSTLVERQHPTRTTPTDATGSGADDRRRLQQATAALLRWLRHGGDTVPLEALHACVALEHGLTLAAADALVTDALHRYGASRTTRSVPGAVAAFVLDDTARRTAA